MNQALYSVVRPTNADYVSEYGFIPALLAAGAAIAPMLGGGKKKKAADKAKQAAAAAKAKQEEANQKRKTMLMIGGVALAGLAMTAFLMSRKGKRK